MITLLFSLGSLLLLYDFSLGLLVSIRNMPLGLIILVLAPIAGGFTAGMISKDDARRAGLIAGVGASSVVFITGLFISWEALYEALSGLVVDFLWIFLSCFGSSLASKQ